MASTFLNSSAARANSPCLRACCPARKERSIWSSDVWPVVSLGVIDQAIRSKRAAFFTRTFSRENRHQVSKIRKEEFVTATLRRHPCKEKHGEEPGNAKHQFGES